MMLLISNHVLVWGQIIAPEKCHFRGFPLLNHPFRGVWWSPLQDSFALNDGRKDDPPTLDISENKNMPSSESIEEVDSPTQLLVRLIDLFHKELETKGNKSKTSKNLTMLNGINACESIPSMLDHLQPEIDLLEKTGILRCYQVKLQNANDSSAPSLSPRRWNINSFTVTPKGVILDSEKGPILVVCDHPSSVGICFTLLPIWYGQLSNYSRNFGYEIFIGLSPFPVIVEMKVYRDSLLKT